MSILKLPIAGSTFATTVTVTLARSTVSGNPTPSASDILTVTTTAAHGLSVGNAVTFSGSTLTAYNGAVFQVLSVPTSTTFTIATSLAQLTGTTIYVVPVYFPAPGSYYVQTGANAVWFADGTNLSAPQFDPTATTVTGTQTQFLAASSTGYFWTDGFGAGLLCNTGSAGTSTLFKVK